MKENFSRSTFIAKSWKVKHVTRATMWLKLPAGTAPKKTEFSSHTANKPKCELIKSKNVFACFSVCARVPLLIKKIHTLISLLKSVASFSYFSHNIYNLKIFWFFDHVLYILMGHFTYQHYVGFFMIKKYKFSKANL